MLDQANSTSKILDAFDECLRGTGVDILTKAGRRAALGLLTIGLKAGNPDFLRFQTGEITAKQFLAASLELLPSKPTEGCGGCGGKCSHSTESESEEIDDLVEPRPPKAFVLPSQLEEWKDGVSTPKFVKINRLADPDLAYHFNVTRYGHAIGLIRVIPAGAGFAFMPTCHVGPRRQLPPLGSLELAMESILDQYAKWRPAK